MMKNRKEKITETLRKMKNRGLKFAAGLLAGVMLLTGMPVQDVHAMSYNKAVTIYDNTVVRNWARKGYKKTITDDIRNNGCWINNDKGKKVYLSSLYYSSNVKYIYKDLDGDGTVEALYFISAGLTKRPPAPAVSILIKGHG